MKQDWINQKEQERQDEINQYKNQMHEALTHLQAYSEEEIQIFLNQIDTALNIEIIDSTYLMPYTNENLCNRWNEDHDLWFKTKSTIESFPLHTLADTICSNYKRYLDSSPTHFHGDIIITDPCYVIKDEDWSHVCDHIYEPTIDLIPGSIMRDTIYGDWSCTVFDKKTKEPIGHFCADAGMVAVFDLEQVLKYNPNFDSHITKDWTTTLIKDFDGDIWFEVKYHKTRYGDDYSVHVVGKGINIKTGKPIQFISKQTGL